MVPGGVIVGGEHSSREPGLVEEARMDTVGPWELLIIVVVLVALFGANRLPKMARGLGEGIREFKKGIAEAGHNSATDEPTDAAAQGARGPTEQPPQPAEQPHTPSR